jgi:hypothetical protein
MKRLSWLSIALVLLAGCSGGSSHDAAAKSTTSHAPGTSAAASGTSGSAGPSQASPGVTTSPSTVSPLVPDGSTSDVAVSSSQFQQQGRTWPLKVPSGTLSCLFNTQIVFKTDDGAVYAVNDAARASGEWEDLAAIVSGGSGGVGKVRADLTAAGAGLCG